MKKVFITPEDYRILSAILDDYPYEVIVFGSRMKGTQKKFSDLDLCLKSIQPIDLSSIGLLKVALSESNLPFSVDVIDYQDISESFKKIIDTEGVNIKDTRASLLSP